MKNKSEYVKQIGISLLFVVPIIILLVAYSYYVKKISTGQCYEILDDSRKQFSLMLFNELNLEKEHLEASANVIGDILTSEPDNVELILVVMNASKTNTSYSHWELCYPDGTVMKNDGSQFSLGENYSFEERINEEFALSERRTAIRDGKTQIVMLSKCIFSGDECIGILSSVIDVVPFADHVLSSVDRSAVGIMMFETGTGDILIDSWHQELGNVYETETELRTTGYKFSEICKTIEAGGEGRNVYVSDIKNDEVYTSYAGLGLFDLGIIVASPGSVAMKASKYSERASYLLIFLLGLFFLAYLAYAMNEARKRQIFNVKRTKELQDALQKANTASIAKTMFLSRMSHDLHTPLNGIIGILEIGKQNPNDVELLKANRDKAIKSANDLLKLIDDVLEWANLEDGVAIEKTDIFNIKELVTESKELMELKAQDAEVTISYELEDVTDMNIYAKGSTSHLRQVYNNLLSYAISNCSGGGKVNVRCTEFAKNENTVAYKLSIIDNGKGLSKEQLAHLFDTFADESNEKEMPSGRSGLGMAITKAIVERMGGSIAVESILGEGTSVFVVLPFELVPEKNVEEKKEEDKPSISGKSILVVEDNDLNAEIATLLLKGVGASVAVAHNGQEAVDMFSSSEPGTYDVILMDLMMPVMDGLTAARTIRGLSKPSAKTIPIIALTANSFAEDVNNCMEAGMNAHLAKPLNLDLLIKTISSLVK